MDTEVFKATTPSDNRAVIEETTISLLNDDREKLLAYTRNDITNNQAFHKLIEVDKALCVQVLAAIFLVSQKAYFYGAANTISRIITGNLRVKKTPFKPGDPK